MARRAGGREGKGGEQSEVASPRATEPIDWLHISDLHITAPESERQRWVLKDLLRDLPDLLKAAALEPRLVFVTGDIALKGARDEYVRATAFFRDLANLLGVDPHDAFFVVPGNHDVDRGRIRNVESLAQKQLLKKRAGLGFRKTLDATFSNEAELEPYGQRLSSFFDFSASLLGDNRAARPGRPFRTDVRDIGGQRIGVASLCSAWMCGPDDDRKGRIVLAENQVRQALDELATGLADLRIVLLHHPLDWLHPAEDRGVRELLQARAHIVMHGHLHVTEAASSSSATSGFILGAAGATYDGPLWGRSFSVGRYDPRAERVSIFPFAYNERGGGAWIRDDTVPGTEDGAARFALALEKLRVTSKGSSLDALVTRMARVTAEICDRALFIGLPSRAPRPDVRLSDLFVPLDLDPIDPLPGVRRLRMSQFHAELFGDDAQKGEGGRRFVVLGDPGSGKTTLCRHIVVQIAESKPGLAPLLLVVRDYVRRGDQRGLLTFLAEEARQHYSLPVGSESVLERLCEEGRVLLLIDGLDEVDSPQQREDLRQKIESLALCHPKLAILVTSRFVGYDHGPLSQEFRHLKLAPFDDAALRSFVERWCRLAEPAYGVGGDQRAADLWKALEADPRVKRLARQPFLATLIAMVQGGETRLPGDRAQLLDLFVETLVKSWPSASGRPFRDSYLDEGRLLSLLQRLALRLLEAPTGEGRYLPSMSRRQMADGIRDILRERAADRGEEEYPWPVEDWLDWLTKACGILVEQQPGYLSFLHPSLLSFLAGQALFARESPEGFAKVAALVRRYHRDPRWSEPLLLMLGRHATDGKLIEAVYRELSEAAEESADQPVDRLDTLTSLVAMLREEVDLPRKQVEEVLTLAARTATEVSNSHLTATSRWIGDVARHSYRHGEVVSTWFLERARQARLLGDPGVDLDGAERSELQGVVLLASDANPAAIIEVLDGRPDHVKAAGDLLDIWPLGRFGAWSRKRTDRAGILDWARRQSVGVTCWRAIACLEDGWRDGAAAQTVALMRRTAWLGHVHARDGASAPRPAIRWRFNDALVEVPVLPAVSMGAAGAPMEGSTHPVGAEQAQTFALSFASGPVARSYDLNTQRGFARGLSRRLGGEIVEALSSAPAPSRPARPEPSAIARCVVDLLSDAFEPSFAGKLRASLDDDLGLAADAFTARRLTISETWQSLTDDARSAAGLITLVAGHAAAGLSSSDDRVAPAATAATAAVLVTVRLQNLWLNLFLDSVAERALETAPSGESLALLLALGLAQRQTTHAWPEGASWRTLFDEPPVADHWLPLALWWICRLYEEGDRDSAGAIRAREAISTTLARGEWGELATEIGRHALDLRPLR